MAVGSCLKYLARAGLDNFGIDVRVRGQGSPAHEAGDVDGEEEDGGGDGGDDDGVVLLAAVGDADALDEDHDEGEVCAALLLEGDDHHVDAEEDEHGLDEQEVQQREAGEAGRVREHALSRLRRRVQGAHAHDEQERGERAPRVVEDALGRALVDDAGEGDVGADAGPEEAAAEGGEVEVDPQRRVEVRGHAPLHGAERHDEHEHARVEEEGELLPRLGGGREEVAAAFLAQRVAEPPAHEAADEHEAGPGGRRDPLAWEGSARRYGFF